MRRFLLSSPSSPLLSLAIVVSCGAPVAASTPPPAVDGDRFACDLRTRLVGWYHLHAADAAGGNDLGEAISAVDPALATQVLDPADDPFAHDLLTTDVWSHPDVVFPGSDRRWIGAYDRADGTLISIDDVE